MNQNLKLIVIAVLVFLISMSVGMLVTNNMDQGSDPLPYSGVQNNLIMVHPDTLHGIVEDHGPDAGSDETAEAVTGSQNEFHSGVFLEEIDEILGVSG